MSSSCQKNQVAPFRFKIVINITLLASYTKVPMFVNGPLYGHAHLKKKGLALMNILELAYSLSKLKHHLLAHKK
jgi:hypothetical protein